MQTGGSNRFFSWISFLTVTGVAIGVAAMIVVWSVINGFEAELRKRFLVANSHVMAYRFPSGLVDYKSWEQTIRKDFGDKITGASPFVHYETLARKTSLLHATLIRGTNPREREDVQSLASVVTPSDALAVIQAEITAAQDGELPPEIPSVILGTGLLSLLDLKIGETVEFVEPDRTDFGSLKKFRIVGSYDSGLKHYDNKLAIMALTTAQHFFKMGDRVTGLEIGLKDPFESHIVAAAMDKKYDISIREWQSFNKSLFEAMSKQRVVILLITLMVAGVAGFNILTTVFVAVTQRQRDISILKALGATNSQIVTLFVKQGIYVGLLGSIIGAILAVIISNILERYQFVDLPDLYLLAKLPIAYEWWVYVTVSIASIGIAIVAGLFPAYLASHINPVAGFRGNEETV